MPDCFISFLTDDITASCLDGNRRHLYDLVNETRVVSLPPSMSKKERSRWLKTSMRQHIDGDFLYIDCDTIIAENLQSIEELDVDLGAVLDIHMPLKERFKNIEYKKRHIERDNRLGFVSAEDKYFNSGVILCRDTSLNHKFFSEWHRLWHSSAQKGVLEDQPSFSQANLSFNNIIKEIDGVWNCQLVRRGIVHLASAKIIHYFNVSADISKAYIFANAYVYEEIKKTGIVSKNITGLLKNPRAAFTIGSRLISNKKILALLNSLLFLSLKTLFNKPINNSLLFVSFLKINDKIIALSLNIRYFFSSLVQNLKNFIYISGRCVKKHIRLFFFSKIYKCIHFLYNVFFIPKSLEMLIYNKLYPLYIPTYEKTNQAVHPDILYLPENIHPFMITFTPYPFSYDEYENPSILISCDGLHFFEEFKGLNPLVKKPRYDHNNDPDLFYYENKWYILYLETLRPESQNLILLGSSDRHSWQPHIIHTDYLLTGEPPIVSPAFIKTIECCYIFYVDISNSKHEIQFIPLEAGFSLDFNKKQKALIDLNSLNPWHIDVIKDDNFFYMLICCVKENKKNKRYDLYIAKSRDAYAWEISKNKVIEKCYRSTGFIKNKDIYIYYSRQDQFSSCWEIGIVRKRLDYFF
jgi:hypothetical protein